jgi:uncharacterized repeat protein (TIGR01451 family)
MKYIQPRIQWPAVVVFACAALLRPPVVTAFQHPHGPELPNLDKRLEALPQPNAQDQAAFGAAAARLRARTPNAQVDREPITGAPAFITSPRGLLSAPEPAALAPALVDPHGPVKRFVNEHRALFGHGAEALAAARVKREFTTAHNGLRTVAWQQEVDGIPVLDGLFVAHVTRREELVNVSSCFVKNPEAAATAGTPNRAATLAQPPIPARQAIALAARNTGENLTENDLAPAGDAAGPSRHQKFRGPGLRGEATASLVWTPLDAGRMTLCWDVLVVPRSRGEGFRVIVDARTGEVWVRRCLTEYISDATYRVYPSDSPSPFSPGHSTPSTTQPPVVPRVLVVTNAFNTNASPNGWINDGVNETTGNNVDAHLDLNNDDFPDLPRPQGSPFRVFDFALDLTQPPSAYQNASVVQLFYVNNRVHDELYELGFTEAAGNFQVNNFGRGGLGNDAVQADAQDGGGFNNANMFTPPDGSPPRMQMYVFDGPTPDIDGDFDVEIVIHEYIHGLSNRRVGGGVGLSALQSRGMGEGWSDFYALAMLSEPGDDVDGNYAAGGYATFQFFGLIENYYFGIRRYPYSTDMTKNPLTFKDIDPSQASTHPGIPINPVIGGGSADEVHNQGEVWCVALWDARANLVRRLGQEVGNRLMLQLVTDGMNLSPANPNFVQARDAILQADIVNNGGANLNDLWKGFAKRGLGVNATSPSSSTTFGVVESFELPDALLVTPSAGFTGSGPVGGPFVPNSRTYMLTNLPGTNTITWSVINTSSWLMVSPDSGTLAPGDPAAAVTVSLSGDASLLPMGIFAATVLFSNETSGLDQPRSFGLRVGQPDYFTEEFLGDNDLAFTSVTFTPDGSSNFYMACAEPATNFPTPTSAATPVSLTPHTAQTLFLTGTNTISIYGQTSSLFHLSSDGHITLNFLDTSGDRSLFNHFSQPRVSALFSHLHPGEGIGVVTWQELSNRVVVTFENVSNFDTGQQNSFQMEMFYDGVIRLTWLNVGSPDSLVGLSAGTGLPAGFLESDLSGYAACAPPLIVSVPEQAVEGDGTLAGQGRVSLSIATETNLVINLTSSLPGEVQVPATITLPAGETNVAFDLFIVNDTVLDGTRRVSIQAQTPGHPGGSDTIDVLDNDSATLQLVLPASAVEGAGTTQGVVSVSAPVGANIPISLISSDTSEIQVPATVIIPAGQSSATFPLTIVDDHQIDGAQAALVFAFGQNLNLALAAMTVLDNEDNRLTLVVPSRVTEGDGVLVNAGLVHLSGASPVAVTVTLANSDDTEVAVPMTVTIPAGDSAVRFDVTVMDDDLVDGSQTAVLTASAAGFTTASNSVLVIDDESPPEPSNPRPAHLAGNVPANTNLSWNTGRPPGSVTNDVYFGVNPVPGPAELLGTTTSNFWDLPLLAPATTYYWQIVARKTGVTPGPVWQFTTRGLDHFEWGPIADPQFASVPFPVSVTAKDEFGTTVSNFTGSVALSGVGEAGPAANSIVITELEPADPDAIEFMNVSTAPVDISGWQITVYDPGSFPGPLITFTVPSSPQVPPGGLFRLTESGVSPGTYPNFNLGINISWVHSSSANEIAVLLRNGTGAIIDFACAVDAFPNQIISPVTIPTNQWAGQPVAANLNGALNYQRIGNTDFNASNGWTFATPSLLATNAGLMTPFGGDGSVVLSPTNSGPFTDGAWSGDLTVLRAARNLRLIANDNAGHTGTSAVFSVVVQNDLFLSVTDSPDPVTVGQPLTYDIAVTNTGPMPAMGVLLTNRLPTGAVLQSFSSSQGSCSATPGVVTCNLGAIPGGTNALVTIRIAPPTTGLISNLTIVARMGADGDPSNNVAFTTTTVIPPSLFIEDATVAEGQSGITQAVFNVRLTAPASTTVSVNYTTTDGTASSLADYVFTNGLLTFPAGATLRTVVVPVRGDIQVESDETFTVELFSPVGAPITNAFGAGTIVNDDGLPGQIDHFEWAEIKSPQLVGDAIPVVITARDVLGGVASNYTGSARLRALGGAGGGTVEMLAFTGYADTAGEYPNTLAAIRTTFTNFNVTPTTVTNAAQLQTLLVGKHVFLVPEQELGNASIMAALGSTWAAVLSAFTAGGGTVIVCAWSDDGHLILSNGGLMQLSRLNSPASDTVTVTAVHPLTEGVSSPFAGSYISGYSSANGTSVAVNSSAQPVVLYRELGAGRAIMIGSDYFTIATPMDRIVANAVKLAQSGPSSSIMLTPTNTGNFVEGVWLGEVTIQNPASNVVLLAEDPAGYRGASTNFDVLVANDLSISMSDAPDPVQLGYDVTYSLLVSNSGPDEATSVVVSNPVPANAAFVSASASQGACTNEAGAIRCDLGTLPGATDVSLTFVLRATGGTRLTNSARVFRGELEGYTSNDTATATTTLTVPELIVVDASETEGNTGSTNPVPVLVRLSVPGALPITVAYATTPGTASAGTDYLSANGVLTFAPGETNAYIVVPILGDVFDEPAESFFINLSNAVNASLPDPQINFTILDDDPTPILNIADAAGPEGNAGASNLAFTVTLSGPSSLPVSVFYSTANGTATGGSDYGAAANSQFLIHPGQTNVLLPVPVFGDRAAEPDETFFVNLFSVGNATLGDSQALGTILNDDLPQVIVADRSILLAESSMPTNGIIDPDETVTVEFHLRNIGIAATTNLVATLEATGGVTAPGAPQNYGALAPGGPAVGRPFTFTTTGATGSVLTATLRLNDGGTDLGGATFTFVLGRATDFIVLGLSTNGCLIVDINSVCGDDRGGIAVSPSHAFYTGDAGTGRFAAGDLSGGAATGRFYDALASNLRSEQVYSLANGTNIIVNPGGTVTALLEIDGATGILTGNRIDLSAPIVMAPGGAAGIFSGYDRIVLHNGTNVYDVALPSGTVVNLGAMAPPTHALSESWTYWGVAEYFGGSVYLLYVQNSTRIVRTRVPDAQTSTVAAFANLGDMSSFTVSPSRNRWYFQYEGSAQFGGTFETLGFCDATLAYALVDDLSLAVTDAPDPVVVNGTITYTVQVANTGPSDATGVVLSNNLPPGVIFLSATPSQGACSNPTGAVRCTLGTIPAGSPATVTIQVRPTGVTNASSAFSVSRAEPDFITANNNATVTTTVLGAPQISIDDTFVIEGHTGTNLAVFNVRVSPPPVLAVDVSYTTSNGTAVAGVDFVAVIGGLLHFAPGETNQTLTIPVLGDGVAESNETFQVVLSNFSGASAADAVATALILDDEPPSFVSIGDATVIEGNGTVFAMVQLTMDRPNSTLVRVIVSTTNDSALAGSDYTALTPVSGQAQFPPGATSATVNVSILGDTAPEPVEVFHLGLRLTGVVPTNATLGDAVAVCTILDNDAPPELDHFEWSTVPSPQLAGQPFAVAITARDAANNVVLNYYGPVILNASNAAVAPALSGSFVNGVWNGSVSVPYAASNVVLRADAFSGQYGASAPFEVWSALPKLYIERQGSMAVLSWQATWPLLYVQCTTNLMDPDSWQTVPFMPIGVGGSMYVSNAISGDQKFYRLISP